MNLHEFFIVCPLVFLAGFVDADYIRCLREVCDVPVIKAVKVQTVEQIRSLPCPTPCTTSAAEWLRAMHSTACSS